MARVRRAGDCVDGRGPLLGDALHLRRSDARDYVLQGRQGESGREIAYVARWVPCGHQEWARPVVPKGGAHGAPYGALLHGDGASSSIAASFSAGFSGKGGQRKSSIGFAPVPAS